MNCLVQYKHQMERKSTERFRQRGKETNHESHGNTIFITGGGSGIGRGLAEALHKRGNQIIISGRRKSHLEATTKANPGIASVELDLQDPKRIGSTAKKLIAQYPKL